MIHIQINNTTLFETDSPMFLYWHLALTSPTVTIQWNESDLYESEACRFSFEAFTGVNLAYSDKGRYWRIRLSLLGFGFNISRQNEF